MRPSLRFLAVAMVGWAGFRAMTLGIIPGAQIFAAARPRAPEPASVPVMATQFATIEPIAPAPVAPPPLQAAAIPYFSASPMRPMVVPVYYDYRGASAPPAPPMRSTQAIWALPEPKPVFRPNPSPLDDWPFSHLASAAMPARSTVTAPMQTTAPAIVAARIDRIQFTMWAMLRDTRTLTAAPHSLASGGTLGASQAGARLVYNFSPMISAVVRTGSEVGRRGGEVAGGVRVRPLRAIPLWITAERRQAIGQYGGGRNAFAFFAEGGLYDRPMPWGFRLDGYAQGGVVGLSSRDLFADGGLTFSRPLYREFSGGFGVWGGIQPGIYRVDAGPRLSMKVRRNMRVHLDYRLRLAGNAEPGSGPVVTLAGDF